MPSDKKKNVLVGIRLDSESRDLLSWALVKVAEPGDCVVAIHVTRNSDHALGQKLLLEGYLEAYEGLCSIKKVDLKGQIYKGNSIRKVLIREAINYGAVALVVGIDKRSPLGGWTSTARYCTKRLPTTTNVVAINKGKIVFERSNKNELSGLKGDPRLSLCLTENLGIKECQSEYGDSEVGSEISSFEGIQSSKDGSRTSSEDSKIEILSVIHEGKRIPSWSISLFAGDNMDYKPGWPLLLRASSATPQAKHARSMSVVKWVMNLPSRSLHDHSPRGSTIKEIELNQLGDDNDGNETNSSMQYELQKCLEVLLNTNSSDCRWFCYGILKAATDQFSTENLIGKGGSNRVYKGILPDNKAVAVKILESSKEACKDFANEIEIISSLKHKHIMPLIGICIKDHDLISVYDFSSKGSLEEILHGKNKGKHALPWELRYNVAVGIAEGLDYLHNELSRPVIHRDIKSSNILLSDGFEPKLSDFGLAIWGPTDSSFLIQADVVGTFGYLAPEYFMYGKLSDKIDVYAFGVVLLELLSGKRPISFENLKGQQSLVMWAKPIIESGDVKGILDPNLNGNINETQMHRMIRAATLCITRSGRLRPKMRQILELLSGLAASLVASRLTAAIGRRNTMVLGGLTFLAGAAINGGAANVAMLIFGRILLGFGVGFTNQATPVYLSEVAPPRWRGAFNTGFQFFIGIGVVAANCINYGTAKRSWGWRLSLGLAVVPAAIMTIGALLISDTPSSLIERGKVEQARHSLRKVRGKDCDVEAELAELKKASDVANEAKREPFVTIFQRQYRPHLVMSIAIPFFQQLTGINIIAFYAPVLFQSVGFGNDSALIAAIILGLVNLASILVSTGVVDRFGRRFLFLEGGIQMFVCQVGVAVLLAVTTGVSGTKEISKGYAILVLVLMCIYAAGFGWSWGPLSWLIPSEIFPIKIRSTGQSISVAVNFATTFVLSQTFLTMLCHFKYGTFLFYAAWIASMTIFVALFLPETKGIPLDSMNSVWEKHWYWRRFVSG